MKLYTFDIETSEHTGDREAQTRPNGQPITDVIGATTIAPPPVKEGFAVCWNGNTWEQREDHRQKRDKGGVVIEGTGTPYWLPGDTWQTPARYMQDIGALPADAILEQPEKPSETLEDARKRARNSVDNATSASILAGFDYTVGGENLHFSYDSFDQQNFVDSATAIQFSSSSSDVPTRISWNAYRNYTPETGGELVVLDLTAVTFLPIYTAALQHKATMMTIGGQRKAQIEEANTTEAINSLLDTWGI